MELLGRIDDRTPRFVDLGVTTGNWKVRGRARVERQVRKPIGLQVVLYRPGVGRYGLGKVCKSRRGSHG